MAHPFQIEVVAADRKVYSGPVASVVLPGVDGYFGVLAGHAPLLSALAVGVIDIIIGEQTAPVAIVISGGFAEVGPDRVLVLADTAELAADIDIERARMAKERAEERLHLRTEVTDVDRAQAALQRALTRLRAAQDRRM